MLTANSFAEVDATATDILALPHETRQKSRMLLRLASGEEFACNLKPGVCLRHGDKLLAEDGGARRVVEIAAVAESLAEARAHDALQLARAAYHLGNRHVKIEIGVDSLGYFLRLPPDHVLEAMLLKLGCTVKDVQAPFQPEGGAYSGHGHGHGADHHPPESGGPRIHEFR